MTMLVSVYTRDFKFYPRQSLLYHQHLLAQRNLKALQNNRRSQEVPWGDASVNGTHDKGSKLRHLLHVMSGNLQNLGSKCWVTYSLSSRGG
jgi:hypothetical protein